MRIVHWTSKMMEAGISGMKNTVMEAVEAELEMGIEAGICDPTIPEGGKEIKLRRRTIQFSPWTWALERKDSVSFMSSIPPKCFYELPHTVAMQHGTPEYVMEEQLRMASNPLTLSLNMPFITDATVTWSEREASYWRQLDLGSRKVVPIRRGVDLQYWTPEGDKFDFYMHPQVAHLEVFRGGAKWGFTFLFAAKYAQRKVPTLRAQFGCLQEQHLTHVWMQLITKLNLDLPVESLIVGVHPEVIKYYRAVDILVCPVHQGHISRVGAEAMACGCPVIALEGMDDQYATLKCRDDPVSMGEAILKVVERLREDPKKVREEARKIAEDRYDINNTVKGFVKLAEELT